MKMRQNRVKEIYMKIVGMAVALMMTVGMISVGVTKAADVEDVTPLSKAAILYEATTDTVIYEKNADMALPPASMTKVMTAIIVLEDNPELEGSLVVDERALKKFYCSWIDWDKHLEVGEEISCYECMKFMLLHSANEATTAFAFSMYDDYSEFVNRMNEKAKELGCEDTQFSDTSGLSASNHVTPRDMVKICQEAMKNEKFREIVHSEGGELPVSNMREEPLPYSTLLDLIYPDERYESPYSEYILGIKTGWIPASGYCYSCCMEKDGYEYYSVIMNAEETEVNGRWAQGDFLDTLNLLALTDDFTPPEKGMPIGGIITGIAVIVAIIGAVMVKKKDKFHQ